MFEKKRRPTLAFILSLLVPGLGHVYVGLPLLGVSALLIVYLFLVVSNWALFGAFATVVVFLVLFVVLRLAIAVHAALRAKRVGVVALRPYQRWYVYFVLLIAVQAVAFFVLPQVVRSVSRYHTYSIPATSMEPTLEIGDRIVVDMRSYRTTPPKRGDVIVFRFPADPTRDMVKRCVAVPGDTIQIVDKEVRLNGQPLTEEFAVHRDPRVIGAYAPGSLSSRDNCDPITVPEKAYYCLGDNRDMSSDSRFWGWVMEEHLRGRALFVHWSDNLSRIGTSIE